MGDDRERRAGGGRQRGKGLAFTWPHLAAPPTPSGLVDTGERPPCGGHIAGDQGGRRQERGVGATELEEERAWETEPSVGKAGLGPDSGKARREEGVPALVP